MVSKLEMRKLVVGDPIFPANLTKVLGKKAPQFLYVMGNLNLLKKASIGFCGSRKATEIGLETARDCAAQAAAHDICVISGNAAGVDCKAHYEALACGGSTILVLPEGLENFRVRRELRQVWDWDRVLVVSQFELTVPWRAYHAMARNKVILGMSKAMIVIEAGERGGTLDAGKSTLRARMPLFVAQYRDDRPEAKGNRMLLNEGGQPLCRLRSTQRANMKPVWAAFDNPEEHLSQRSLI